MQPKTTTIRTADGVTFDLVEWTGRNESWIKPYSSLILVLPDQAVEKIGSIIIPEMTRDRLGPGAETGVIVQIGDQAFKYNRDRTPWVGDKPSVGDRIFFIKYAGTIHMGRDGLLYRVIDTDSVYAGLDPPPEAEHEHYLENADMSAAIEPEINTAPVPMSDVLQGKA